MNIPTLLDIIVPAIFSNAVSLIIVWRSRDLRMNLCNSLLPLRTFSFPFSSVFGSLPDVWLYLHKISTSQIIFHLLYYRHLSRTSRVACNVWFAVENFSIQNESSEAYSSRVLKFYDITNTRFWVFIKRAAYCWWIELDRIWWLLK